MTELCAGSRGAEVGDLNLCGEQVIKNHSSS